MGPRHEAEDDTLGGRGLSRFGLGGLIDQRLEARGVLDGEIGQHLAVDLDPGLVQAVDKSSVGEPVLAHRRVDALDPERAERALLTLAVEVLVLQRLLDRLLGDPDRVLAPAAVALGGVRTFLCLAWAVTPRLTRAMGMLRQMSVLIDCANGTCVPFSARRACTS